MGAQINRAYAVAIAALTDALSESERPERVDAVDAALLNPVFRSGWRLQGAGST